MEDKTTREYELAVMVDDSAAEKNIDEFLAVPDYAVEVAGKDAAKMLSLAYPIKKRTSATLLVYYLRLLPENIARIRKDLTFQPYVLRSMIIAKQAVEKEAAAPAISEASVFADKPSAEISSTEELVKTLEGLR